MANAYQVGQVVNGNTITGLPGSGAGNYADKYQLTRPDGTTFYDYLSAAQLQAEDVNLLLNGDAVNTSNPVPVYVVNNTGNGGTASTTASTSALVTSASASLSTPAHSASSSSLVATNANRKGIVIYNDSASATAYLSYASTSSLTTYTRRLPPGAEYENNFIDYTGPISFISDVVSGNLHVTEMS